MVTQSNTGCSAEIEGVNGPGETLAGKDVVAWCLRVRRSAQVQDSVRGWKALRGAGVLEEVEEGQGGWSMRAIVSRPGSGASELLMGFKRALA